MNLAANPFESSEQSAWNILYTNAFLETWTGSELYIRDVAVEMIKRGHKPVVFSPRLGKLALEFREKSIPVADVLSAVGVAPDLIHGQHHLETMIALSHFPSTPAVYFCHGWLPWEEQVPVHPRILIYVTVSDALRDRLMFEYGIPSEKIVTIYNFVDMEKFQPRPALPAAPKKALVFNNQINQTNYMDAFREACTEYGITLDVIGYEAGNPTGNPEQQIGRYDLVFARGRAALEAIAVGAACVCSGSEGVGEMVTSQNLEWMRRNNFGIRVMPHPITKAILAKEIRRYEAMDAQKVSLEVRSAAGLTQAVDQILGVYQSALDEWANGRHPDPAAEGVAVSRYLHTLADEQYRLRLDGNRLAARVDYLQAEMDDIHGRAFWKAYVKVARIAWLRRIYLGIAGLLGRQPAEKGPPSR